MRILITGPECTGKSTLAEQLSTRLQIPWMPEYARTYLEEFGKDYTLEDVLKIGQTHHHLLHSFTPDQPLILDTYLLNLVIWLEHKYGFTDEWITAQAKGSHFDYVFLMNTDLDWHQDGYRESAGKTSALLDVFKEKLTSYGFPFHLINGQKSSRLESVLSVINSSN